MGAEKTTSFPYVFWKQGGGAVNPIEITQGVPDEKAPRPNKIVQDEVYTPIRVKCRTSIICEQFLNK